MPIRFKCQHCNKGLVVKEQMAGKKALCPACKKPVMVPAPVSQAVDVESLAVSALSDRPAAEEKKEAAAPLPPIEMTCPFCAEQVKFDGEMGGKQAPCPNPECRRIIKVPLPEGTKRKDWRDVKAGPSGAMINQPEQLDGAWGTATHKAKVSQTALFEADAIVEEKEPVGVAGWIKRGLWLTVIGGVIVLAWWGLNRRRTEGVQKEGIEQALEAVEGQNAGKYPPAWAAVIHRGAGEYYTHQRKASDARAQFNKARGRIGVLTSSPDKDLLALYVALPQVDLGGTEEEDRHKERIAWDGILVDLDRTLNGISDAEALQRAVREVGTLLLKRMPNVAVTLPGRLGAGADKGVRAELLKAQQAALAMASPKYKDPVIPPPNPKLKLQDRAARIAYAEGHARKGDLAEARQYITADGNFPEHRFEAALGVAAVLLSEGKDLGDFVTLASDMAKGAKKISPWQTLEMVRLQARAGSAAEAAAWLKQLPAKQMKAWGELEIFLAELARSNTKVEASRVEGVGDKDSLPHALAWEAFARHNTRLGYGSEVSALIRTDDPERKKIKPLLHLGMALGTQDRER